MNVDFTPFVLDSVGGFHDLAMDHIQKLAERLGRSREVSRGVAAHQMKTRLSVALKRTQAESINKLLDPQRDVWDLIPNPIY